MAEPQKEAYGPSGDAARHLALAALQEGLRALAAPPREVGRVTMIVRRRPDGARELPESACLEPGTGVPGDG